MASASEAASWYFVANLGNLDPAIVERLERWAAASCVDYASRRAEDGSVALYAAKASAKKARQYQSLLRTLSSQWSLPFGKLERGWLNLLTETEYRGAVEGATARKDCAGSDPVEVVTPSECAAPCAYDVSEAIVVAAPKLPEVDAGVILFSLGDGFDARARAGYERLLAERCAMCAE